MRLNTPREVGLFVREERRARNMTQQELATRVGATRQWVRLLEQGREGLALGLTLRALRAVGAQLEVLPGPAGIPPSRRKS
jgi:transcriptional regulator with XRE-family HTH domain